MANQEHVDILLRSSAAQDEMQEWNQWREEHDDIWPDLSGATLLGVDLRGANLSQATLSRASLRESILFRVNLTGATLSGADLIHTTLNGATLINANLTSATLNGATLNGATLREAALSDINLSDATLYMADLSGAIIKEAILSRANLIRSNLSDADLKEAILTNTNLRGATLLGANLTSANLTSANLLGANLINANLISANLISTDLSSASIGNTIFADVDLRTCVGLDTIQHLGPSSISSDTFYKSQGQIPDVFLQGCGLPDELISFVHSIAGAIQYYSAFISYNSQDEPFAHRLYSDLQAHNVRCWKYTEDVKIGDKILQRVDEAIRLHDKLLLILSESSLASDWVEREVLLALEREHREKRTLLFPVRIDDAILQSSAYWASLIKTRNIGDFTHWKDADQYQPKFERLLRDLKQAGSR